MRAESFIAARIFSMRKESISSTIVRVAVLSVALGLSVMMVSVAVVIGFKNQIRDKVTGFVADIQIEALNNNSSSEALPFTADTGLTDALEASEQIVHYQFTASKAGIIKTEDHILGVVLKGVGSDFDWQYLRPRILEGQAPVISDTALSNEVLISRKIADKLVVAPGQSIRMWFVDAASQQPRGRKFTVSGIYETGMSEFDERYLIGDIGHVQKLYNWQPDQYALVEVELRDDADAAMVSEQLYYEVPVKLNVTTAAERFPQIFDWLQLQDMNVWIILLLMLMVSAITMVSTLLIMILERTPMIGILKAMGAGNHFIRRMFLLNSYRILLNGMIWGNLLALTFIGLQLQFGLFKLPEASYYLSEVPVELHWAHFIGLNGGLFLLWSASLLIPVTVINAIDPAKAIRYA